MTHVVALTPGTDKVCILPFVKSNVGNSQNLWQQFQHSKLIMSNTIPNPWLTHAISFPNYAIITQSSQIVPSSYTLNPSTNLDREDVLQQKHMNVEGGINMVNATKKENQLTAQEQAEPRKLKSSISNIDAN